MRARYVLTAGAIVLALLAGASSRWLAGRDVHPTAYRGEVATPALSTGSPTGHAPVAAEAPVAHDHRQALARHEQLAARAQAGELRAALALAQLLDACTEREETRLQMAALAEDWGAAPACDSSARCRADAERIADLQAALAMVGARELDCRDIPHDWLLARGRWLLQAAESGDSESMACYALVGGELAPPPTAPDYPAWMARWHEVGLDWAWDAWRRGDPRGALALARIYGPRNYFRGEADDLADEDPRWHRRFALLLTRALALAPDTSDLAAAAAIPAPDDAVARADQAWVQAELPRMRARLPLASRTPDDCWRHFELFPRAATEPPHTR